MPAQVLLGAPVWLQVWARPGTQAASHRSNDNEIQRLSGFIVENLPQKPGVRTVLLVAQHAGVVGEHGHREKADLAFDEIFMADSVQTILARLEPIKGTVVFRPLNAEALQSLEREAGLAIPSALREYFSVVGLFEDLTALGNSDYEVFTRLNEFREMRQFLVREFGPPAANLFLFAGDGAGDVIAVKEGPEQGYVVFCRSRDPQDQRDRSILGLVILGRGCSPRSQRFPEQPKKVVCAVLLPGGHARADPESAAPIRFGTVRRVEQQRCVSRRSTFIVCLAHLGNRKAPAQEIRIPYVDPTDVLSRFL